MSVPPSRIGVVAGGGSLPRKLVEYCDTANIQTFVIGLDGHVDTSFLNGRDHLLMRIGEAGQIIRMLKDKGLQDIVLIGSVKRPRLSEMRPDLRTVAFFAKLGLRALGDDGLLKAVRAELEDEGFTVHGIQDIVPDLLMPYGVLTSRRPDDEQQADIALGLSASRKIGAADIGQSVVILNGHTLGLEDEDGTNALIKRAAESQGAILVKSSKPQQDRKLDMPTIGPETIRLCASLGYAGIAAEAGGVLLTDREEMIRLADEVNLFLAGV